jgi:hypothetical protein
MYVLFVRTGGILFKEHFQKLAKVLSHALALVMPSSFLKDDFRKVSLSLN